MKTMNNWKAIAYIFLGIGIILLLVGLLEAVVLVYAANSISAGLGHIIFVTFLPLFIPYLGFACVFFVIAGVGFYASKPQALACPSCGRPIRYIEQYGSWYCDNEKKYLPQLNQETP
jgi:hypothetical protein